MLILYSLYIQVPKSANKYLRSFKKNYLEGLFVAQGGGDHIEIRVCLFDGYSLIPITSNYLSEDAN